MNHPKFHELGRGLGTAAPCRCSSGSSFPLEAGGAGRSPAPARGKVTLHGFSGLWIINDCPRSCGDFGDEPVRNSASCRRIRSRCSKLWGSNLLDCRGLNPEQPQIPGDPILAFSPLRLPEQLIPTPEGLLGVENLWWTPQNLIPAEQGGLGRS